MRGWLSGAFAAARLASERADLWLPGSLAAFAAAGWLVLLLTVTPLPSAADAAGADAASGAGAGSVGGAGAGAGAGAASSFLPQAVRLTARMAATISACFI